MDKCFFFFSFCLCITIMHTVNEFMCECDCQCVCVCVLSLPGRQPAVCQWEVVYPAQTLAVYTALFITGTVLLNYHLIYGLAWCVYVPK